MEFYNNSQYRGSIENKKTLVLDSGQIGTAADNAFPPVATPNHTNLTEPLKIDAITDIYLDSFTTFNCKKSDSEIESGFLLTINEFNSNIATNDSALSNSIFIPNEQSSNTLDVAKTHKGKKLNYVGYLLPQNIRGLTGKVTALNGTDTMGENSKFRVIAEFVLITRD